MSEGPRRSPWLGFLVRGSLRHPRVTLLCWGLVCAVASLGILRLEIDTSTSSFLDRGDPAWAAYQRSLELYGGDEFLVVALEGRERLDPSTLEASLALTDALRTLPGVRRVDSLSTVPLIRSGEGGVLELDAGLARGLPERTAERERLYGWWRADRLVPGSLIAADETLVSINVLFDGDVDGDRAVAVARARELLGDRPGWITGVPVFRTAVNSRTRAEVLVFVPLTLALISLVLALAMRGWQAIAVPLAVGGVGSAVALGAMGALGIALSLSTMVLPSILLGLGCAYSMHVLTAARDCTGAEERAVAFEAVSQPIALSGLTTVIGFLAMATVPIAAISQLATFGALGVFVCTAAALSLAPAALGLREFGDRGRALDAWIRGPLRRWLVAVVARRRRPIVALWIAALGIFAIGIARLEVATDIILWFPEGSEIRDAYETVRARLSGITPVNVLIEPEDGAASRSVTTPRAVATIDRLTRELEALPQVGRALSFTDPLRQLHAALGADTGTALPEKQDQIEQYLLLLEGIEQLDDVLRSDWRGANVLLRVDENASSEIVELGEWIGAWWDANGVPGYRVQTTGIMYEFGRAEEAIAYGQIRGLGLALLAIGLIMLVLFRALRPALFAFLTNAVPLGIAFGFMGLVGIPLDAATVCMGSVALGIAVDDTIHVLLGFREERERGAPGEEAISRCLARVLPALVFTTASVGAGFAVLGVSDFTLIRNLGCVTAGVVGLCLVADLTLLPALLLGGKQPSSAPRS